MSVKRPRPSSTRFLNANSSVQRHVDDLGAQLLSRAQRHVGHGHFLQVGDVFFQILQRVFDLQSEQTAQARAVFGRGDFGLVEHLHTHRVAAVDQGGKADEGLTTLTDFHEFGQIAEGPGGVGGWLRCASNDGLSAQSPRTRRGPG
jgi:hypothetical protein